MQKACDFLNEKMPDDIDIENALVEFQSTGEQVYSDIQKMLSNRTNRANGNVPFNLGDEDDEDDSHQKENRSTSNARGSKAPKATTSKATASKATASRASTSGRGRGASRSAAFGTTAKGRSVRH